MVFIFVLCLEAPQQVSMHSMQEEATVFSATISMLEKVVMWEEALSIFCQIPIHKKTRVDYLTTILALHSGAKTKMAGQVFQELADHCVYGIKRNGSLDLHNMPVVVAEMAVEAALSDMEQREHAHHPVLEIITGRGVHGPGEVESPVRQAVLHMLEGGSRVTLLPSPNPGLVLCRVNNNLLSADWRSRFLCQP